ncbi:hypothetical protein NPIL_404111 [Nephila pilipes]|uniref:Uncharacterized protein n=1 Tax=Nephila pilipes TaxID=299642 RepID=A0A8X6TIY4_NEPPI|nr:hypothetical protein NPIL_404111 [Nephila pilipes]
MVFHVYPGPKYQITRTTINLENFFSHRFHRSMSDNFKVQLNFTHYKYRYSTGGFLIEAMESCDIPIVMVASFRPMKFESLDPIKDPLSAKMAASAPEVKLNANVLPW